MVDLKKCSDSENFYRNVEGLFTFEEIEAVTKSSGLRNIGGCLVFPDGSIPKVMEKFTVLLLYPDYDSQSYGEDTWLSHVSEISLERAILRAKKEAGEANLCDFEDYTVLFATYGWHKNLI